MAAEIWLQELHESKQLLYRWIVFLTTLILFGRLRKIFKKKEKLNEKQKLNLKQSKQNRKFIHTSSCHSFIIINNLSFNPLVFFISTCEHSRTISNSIGKPNCTNSHFSFTWKTDILSTVSSIFYSASLNTLNFHLLCNYLSSSEKCIRFFCLLVKEWFRLAFSSAWFCRRDPNTTQRTITSLTSCPAYFTCLCC